MKPTKLFLALSVAVLLGACGTKTDGNTTTSEALGLPPMGQFVIKGEIQNIHPDTPSKISLAVCDIWENELYDIPIQPNGTFAKTIPVRDMQEVYL